MAEETVSILAVLKDRFSGPIRKIATGFRTLLRVVKSVGRGINRVLMGTLRRLGSLAKKLFSFRVLLIGVFGGVAILRTFAKFQRGLAQVSTLIDDSASKMKKLGDGVIRVAQKTGDSFDSLNKGLFDLISSGVEAGEALKVLEQSAKLAAAGGTETAVAVDGVTSILNAYGRSAEEAGDITDTFFQAMKKGKTTIAELASGIGKVVSSAAALNVNFEEVSSAIAALTLSGISTSEATTALNGLFTSLIKPVEKAIPLAEAMKEQLRGEGGLIGAIDLLQIESNKLGDGIAELFPNIRALKSVFSLTARDGVVFKDILGSMATKANAVNINFEKIRNTMGNQFQRALRSIQVLFIRIGEAAAPFIGELLDKFQAFVDGLSAKRAIIEAIVRSIAGTIQRSFSFLKTLIKEGEVIQFVLRLGGELIVALVKLQIVLIPAVIKIATAIGRVFGLSLVKAIFGSSKLAVVEGLAKGGFFAKLTAVTLKASLSSKEFDDIMLLVAERQAAEASPFMEQRIAEFREKLTTEDAGIGDKTSKALQRSISKGIEDVKRETQKLLVEAIDGTRKVLGDKAESSFKELTDFLRGITTRVAEANLKDALQDLMKKGLAEFVKRYRIIKSKLDSFLKSEASKDAGKIPTGMQQVFLGKDEFGPPGLVRRGTEQFGPPGQPSQAFKDRQTAEEKRNDFFGGISEGIKTISREMSDFAALGADIAHTFASTLSSAFVTLFREGRIAFREFASTFLAQIAQMILQALIFRAVASFFPSGGDSNLALPGKRQGGRINRGFGGPVFGPKGRDVIPANLTRDEYVMRPEATKYYGMNLMSAINALLIPRKLLAGVPRASTGVSVGNNFAGGGPVRGSSASAGVPVLYADEQFADRFLNGRGRRVMLRFMDENKSSMNTQRGS